MARVSARRRRDTSKSRRGGAGRRILHFILSWQFLRVAFVALILGTLIFFHRAVTEAIFGTLGLGIILVASWIAIIVLILWQRRFGSVLRNWNRWLGALLLSAALLGIMALFHPAINIVGVKLADVTLAGSLGQLITGTSYTWARLLGLVLLGVVFVAPKHSLSLARGIGSFTWQLAINLVTLLSLGFWSLLQKITSLLIPLPRLLWARMTTLFETKPVALELPQSEEVLEEQIPPVKPARAESEFSEAVPEPEEQPIVEEAMLPDIARELPPIELLDEAPKAGFAHANDAERARLIEEALASYGVEVKVQQINPGPSVTQFGVEPGWARRYRRVVEKEQNGKPKLDKDGNPKVHMEEVSKTRVKVERITALANDLALALAVPHIRIEAPVPGKSLVGIEVPNISTDLVSLRHVIESPVFQKAGTKSKLAVALGQGAGGEPAVGDIAKMPHMLIAGATGSGKTVCLNCIITCLLTQTTPAEVRFILLDPKRVEMVTFSGVPHLMTPVVVDTDKAIEALRRVTMEMDHRYRKFASVGVRNIDLYNRSPKVVEPLPYLIVIIDELADLMMTAPDVAEPLLCRLAQLSRATGIHLIVATQRPSVDVITGLIKANFPTRISFAVVSSVDSRTILDAVGAEKLLGRGDMLYVPPEAHKPKRIRGCFVSDDEMDRIVDFWKEWAAKHFPQEADHVGQEFASLSVERLDTDPFLEKARQLCDESSHVSTSLLQRRLHIGYPRAARLMEQLEEEGLVESREYGRPWEGEP